MSVRQAILGLLSDGPLHGYELKQLYEHRLVPGGQLNFGQVYTSLDRLNRDGLVVSDHVARAGSPDRKVYSLTAAGQAALAEWLSTPSGVDLDLRNETYLKLMIAERLPDGDPLAVIRIERRSSFERLHEVKQAHVRDGGADQPTTLLLELAALRLEAFLKWLDRCEEVFAQENIP